MLSEVTSLTTERPSYPPHPLVPIPAPTKQATIPMHFPSFGSVNQQHQQHQQRQHYTIDFVTMEARQIERWSGAVADYEKPNVLRPTFRVKDLCEALGYDQPSGTDRYWEVLSRQTTQYFKDNTRGRDTSTDSEFMRTMPWKFAIKFCCEDRDEPLFVSDNDSLSGRRCWTWPKDMNEILNCVQKIFVMQEIYREKKRREEMSVREAIALNDTRMSGTEDNVEEESEEDLYSDDRYISDRRKRKRPTIDSDDEDDSSGDRNVRAKDDDKAIQRKIEGHLNIVFPMHDVGEQSQRQPCDISGCDWDLSRHRIVGWLFDTTPHVSAPTEIEALLLRILHKDKLYLRRSAAHKFEQPTLYQAVKEHLQLTCTREQGLAISNRMSSFASNWARRLADHGLLSPIYPGGPKERIPQFDQLYRVRRAEWLRLNPHEYGTSFVQNGNGDDSNPRDGQPARPQGENQRETNGSTNPSISINPSNSFGAPSSSHRNPQLPTVSTASNVNGNGHYPAYLQSPRVPFFRETIPATQAGFASNNHATVEGPLGRQLNTPSRSPGNGESLYGASAPMATMSTQVTQPRPNGVHATHSRATSLSSRASPSLTLPKQTSRLEIFLESPSGVFGLTPLTPQEFNFKNFKLSEFFELYARKMRIHVHTIKSLTFVLVFDDYREIEVEREHSEDKWELAKLTLKRKVEYIRVKKPEKKDLHVWVKMTGFAEVVTGGVEEDDEWF